MASSSLLKEAIICNSTTTMEYSFEEARFHSLAPTTMDDSTTTTMEYSYYIPTVSFEEARFHNLTPTTMDEDDNDDEWEDRIQLKQTALPFQELMLCTSGSTKERTIKDYFYSYFSTMSIEESRFLHGPQSEYWKAKSESNAKAKKKYTAAAKNNSVLRKTAMKNSMLKKGGIEAKVAGDVFVINTIKQSKRRAFERRQQFKTKTKPSKLGPNNCNAPNNGFNFTNSCCFAQSRQESVKYRDFGSLINLDWSQLNSMLKVSGVQMAGKPLNGVQIRGGLIIDLPVPVIRIASGRPNPLSPRIP
ncbi:hypothetical protein PIB30_006540 [Stylosanthes scabra]|uniref:Uncharacterized protein n=1 Tax=Stylosanthes scabra TaxID=79078 RepID=A0ABU6X4C1_9FABA|nr:hypothetical protein [Stylosanthes scabra]